MGRIAGIAFLVALIWLGLKVYTEGSDSVLALVPGHVPAEPGEQTPAPLDTLRERGRAAVQQQMDRIESQLGEAGSEDGEEAQD